MIEMNDSESHSETSNISEEIITSVSAFLRTGSAKDHAVVMEKLYLDGSDVTWSQVEHLLDLIDALSHGNNSNNNTKNNQLTTENSRVLLFVVNGLKSIIRSHYSIFSVQDKLELYQRAFLQYKKNPNSGCLSELITIIFRYFYDSLQMETSFIEDVKHFCETSVEHLQLGLRLFASVISEMQDYNLIYKCNNSEKQEYNNKNRRGMNNNYNKNNINATQSNRQNSNNVNKSKLNTFFRKKEIAFRQQLLPAIFEIPFQLLNTKREDLLSESDSNYSVLTEVLNLLLNCLSYDYFDQAKTAQGDLFEANTGILSLPCREKRQDAYLNDLRSQEFTSTIFDLLIFMLDKHESISVMCLDIVASLIRLSVKFFKKEDQKFSQMVFIVDGLCRVMQSHSTFVSDSDSNQNLNSKGGSCILFNKLANCISKVPIGISFSDGETSLQGFWDFIVEVHNLTKISIDRSDIRSLECYLEFWCSYDYFLGHDGAQKQEELREIVENILQSFISKTSQLMLTVTSSDQYEEIIENYRQVISWFSKLANTWIDSIEEQLMNYVSDVFTKQSEIQSIHRRRSAESELKARQLFFQLHWGLLLLFSAQSYNIQEELSMTNRHFELDSQDEVKEDVEILCQAFESFGKLFVIVLNLFKGQQEMQLPEFLKQLMLEIVVFLIDAVLAFPNHISFDYLSVLIKFTDQLNLVNHFYLNRIFVFFIETFASKLPQNTESFLTLLASLTSNIHPTEEGLQLGSFPFDMQGFAGSCLFNKHMEGSYDVLSNGLIQKIYAMIFSVIDKHEVYKRKASECDFEKLMLRVSNIDSQKQSSPLKLQQSSASNNKSSNTNNRLSQDSEQQQENVYNQERSSIVGGTSSTPCGRKSISRLSCSSSGKQQQQLQEKGKIIADYLSPFLSVISSRIQLDVQIPVAEQKAIFKGVLNSLIGIVRSASSQTFATIVQFVLANNIFYSMKQVIKQENEMNFDEINIMLKLLVVLWEARIYVNQELGDLLFKEIVDVLILTQQRLLTKGYTTTTAALNSKENDEWNRIIKPMSYQYRLIFAMLQRQSLDFNQVDAQVVVSNMFYCLRLVSPEKIAHYQYKLNWIFDAIHALSESHFDVFLLLQPLEFQAVAQLMEESLNSHFDEQEPLGFFINIMKQVFIGITSNDSQIRSQHLMQSQEILERVLQKIVVKIARKEDLSHQKLHTCLLGFYWMMKSEKFLATVNSVLTNSLHAPIIERFQKFADDIEILDGVMYQLSSDHALYVSKEIFSRLFA